ncbi:hypothetical protein AKJ16_DCAP07166 [Drosera capensis]
MENNHKQANASSEENPILKSQTLSNAVDDVYEFEFSCITTSSTLWDPYQDSPADRFFLNGKLLPHSFPWRSSDGGSRATSRTSSVSSKDSLMWSRSNSVNSKSSSCSSARTSANDREQVIENKSGHDKVTLKGLKSQDLCKYKLGCSKRWQLLIATPALDPFVRLRRRTKSAECLMQGKMSTEKIKGDEGEEKGMRFPCTPKPENCHREIHGIILLLLSSTGDDTVALSFNLLLRRRRNRRFPFTDSSAPQFSLSAVDMELISEWSEEFGDI